MGYVLIEFGHVFQKFDITGVSRVCRGCASQPLSALPCRRDANKYKTWKTRFVISFRNEGVFLRGVFVTSPYIYIYIFVNVPGFFLDLF